MWKMLTAQIRKEIYYSLISRGLFLEEQKGCRKEARATGEVLYVDQHIINESKTRRKILAMAFDWLQKGLRYGPPKLDNTLSQNV